MDLLSTSLGYNPPYGKRYLRLKRYLHFHENFSGIFMSIKFSTKKALCFLMVCKILRTKEIGKGGGEIKCSQIVPRIPSQGQSPSSVAEDTPSKHFSSETEYAVCHPIHP